MTQTELLIGDIAPLFPTLEFIKGQPISAFEAGQIYVLECWAPWCGPCIDTIPHLTQLQKKYPQITVLGVAVWEENINAVHQLVADMGDKMEYRVAYNTVELNEKEGDVARNWLSPALEDGIPTAFIIDQNGKIAWYGHPLFIDSVLEKMINNEFNIDEAAQDYRAYLDKNQIRERKQLDRVLNQSQSENDIAAAIKACDAAFAENVRLEQFMGTEKLNLLISANKGTDALNYAKHLVEITESDDADELQTIGLIIADSLKRNTEIDERFPLLDYAVSILIDLDQLTESSKDYFLKFRITRSLVAALTAREKPQDALKFAELGLNHAINAEFPEDIQNLYKNLYKNLIMLYSAQVDVTSAKTTNDDKIICDGDSCRRE
ncbi:TlpA family protein disulfide reductase [Acinetobacter guillouiae]|uniref:TlpA family protein disulfide reductase n=1 Tax=Acinetobacter guillouiae TaxID=106649 RepID=A0A8X8GJE7_ACIGI|nr:TlpA disulfide reductase family protein [Acinetobacter guillouiae]MCF0263863.1 TlpA family protein disulfide reductase [Acinetobacter guillouiae]